MKKIVIRWRIISETGRTLKFFVTDTNAEADDVFNEYMRTPSSPKSARLQFESKAFY